jgi:hypothetical protein
MSAQRENVPFRQNRNVPLLTKLARLFLDQKQNLGGLNGGHFYEY